jgi:hypothetical protein
MASGFFAALFFIINRSSIICVEYWRLEEYISIKLILLFVTTYRGEASGLVEVMLTLSRGARCFSTARLVEKPQRSFPLSVKSELVLRFKDICSSNKSTDDLKNALYGLLALKNKDLVR